MNHLDQKIKEALGHEVGADQVTALVEFLNEKPIIEKDEDFGDLYYIFSDNGISLYFNEDDLLVSAFLYYVSQGDTKPFKGEYLGVRLQDSFDEISKKFGHALRYSDGGEDSVLDGGVYPFLLYKENTCKINVEFSKDKNSVRLLTVMDDELTEDLHS